MKKMLLILLALFAVSAWAADVVVAPSAQATSDMQAGVREGSGNSLQSVLTPPKAGEATLTTEPGSILTRPAVGACPTGCTSMHCPPPAGPVECCNTTTYKPC